jgi:hypothetical protein
MNGGQTVAAIALLVGCGTAGLAGPPTAENPQWLYALCGGLIAATGVLGFLFSLVIKPKYLYDVRIRRVGDGMVLSSRYNDFLNRVEEANTPVDVEVQ